MPGTSRGIPASQLARDYGVSLNEFSDAVIGLISREWPEQDEATRSLRRREICAAVSAAMTVALEASILNTEERSALRPLIQSVLLPFWNKHCASEDSGLAEMITARALEYSRTQVPDSRVKSAVNMVGALLSALEAPEPVRAALTERLVPVFAHRMVGDVYRMNEVRRKQGIELSMLATVCALLHVSLTYDPILKMLRIG